MIWPCSLNTIKLALNHKLISKKEFFRLIEDVKRNSYPLSVPLLSSEAFMKFKDNNLTQKLEKTPNHLKLDFQDAVETLWSLDVDGDTTFMEVNSSDESVSAIISLLGGSYLSAKLLSINDEVNYWKGEAVKIKRKLANNRRDLINNLRRVNQRINQLFSKEELISFQLNALESYAFQIENDYPDLRVYILSSGRNPFSWERLNAGSCTCGLDNLIINRDYNSSHNDGSVINNFISDPASFYLFTEFGGFERGYARGRIDFNDEELFIYCEALHAKGCNHTNRNVSDESIAELSLISGLMRLAFITGVRMIKWGRVGVSNFYGLLDKKKKSTLMVYKDF